MQASVMESIGETGVIEKDRPEVGPNDAVVRPTLGLVCTSDVHTVHGAIGGRETITLGHEAVGIVEAVGEEVEIFEPGDRVPVGAITPDRGSLAAQDGHPSRSTRSTTASTSWSAKKRGSSSRSSSSTSRERVGFASAYPT